MTIDVEVISFNQESVLSGGVVTLRTAPITPANPAGMTFFGGHLGTSQLSTVVCTDWETFTTWEFQIPEIDDGNYGFEFRYSDLSQAYRFSSTGPVTVNNSVAPSGPPVITRVTPAEVEAESFAETNFRVLGNNMDSLVSFYLMKTSGEGAARFNTTIRRVGGNSIFLRPITAGLKISSGTYSLIGETENQTAVRSRQSLVITAE